MPGAEWGIGTCDNARRSESGSSRMARNTTTGSRMEMTNALTVTRFPYLGHSNRWVSEAPFVPGRWGASTRKNTCTCAFPARQPYVMVRAMQIIPNFWPIALVTCAIALTACGARETSPPGPAAAPNATMAETTGGSKGRPQFQLRRVGEFNEPVAVTQPPGDERLAVVERTGRLLLARAGRSERVLVDLRDAVSTGSEQGLLGVAFHPDFAANRRLFVNYTDQDGDSHVDEYDAGPRDATGSATRVREVLEIDQPYENHNGGNLVFGPDGYLYIGFGDGGSGGDPEGRAQDPGELLGKMLRIDIDSAKPYVAPDDNPFADATPGRDEIWATGLRNPWRYSFDRATGDLYIADVGQGEWEEIDLQRADAHGGANYGWNVREGLVPYDGNGTLQGRRPTDPVHAYSHADG